MDFRDAWRSHRKASAVGLGLLLAGCAEPVTAPLGPDLRGRFVSHQTAGIRVPGLVADSMGGVNGGRLTIQVLDGEGFIIADRDVRPPRGYEFNERAEAVLAGLDARLTDPSGCGGAASHETIG